MTAAKSVTRKFCSKLSTRHSLILTDPQHNPLVVIGRIGRPHGVAGLLHVDRAGDNLRAFTGQEVHLCAASNNAALLDAHVTSRHVKLARCEPAKGDVTRIALEGFTDRDQAAALTNFLIAMPRSELMAVVAKHRKGQPQGLADLWYFEMIGLTVRDAESNEPFARIYKVEDLGHNALVTLEPLPVQTLLSRPFDLPLEYPHWGNVDLSLEQITLAEWKLFAEA